MSPPQSHFGMEGLFPLAALMRPGALDGPGWLDFGTSLAIALALLAISGALGLLAFRARTGAGFRWLLLWLAVLSFVGGLIHLLDLCGVSEPRSWISPILKAVTAVAFITTAVMLPRLIPRILSWLESAREVSGRNPSSEAGPGTQPAFHEAGGKQTDAAARGAGDWETLVRQTLQKELSSQSVSLPELAREMSIRLRELQTSKENAEAANNAKDRFLAVLSHELRTPLTPVLAAVNHLEAESSLPPELRATLEMIRRNVELEARLIDDLLDLTRIGQGKLPLNFETVDLHALLRNAVEICRSGARNKHLEIRERFEATHPHIRADPARMLQVIWNLIQNAVKFTPERGMVEVRTADGSQGMVRIEIADSGIGIDPAALPRIFDAFEQGDSSVTRRFGGLGLGLAVAQALVNAHGGTISARSEGIDQGTTLVVELASIDEGEALAARPATATAIPPAGAALRILLVEDHDDTRTALSRLLGRWGYAVEAVSTVREALEKEERFDLLISDLGLPDGSGLDLMTQLRQRDSTLRGIAISGFGMEQDLSRSSAAGFAEHLIKPVAAQKLRASIERLAAE
jgi:signal transduction histidine kinase